MFLQKMPNLQPVHLLMRPAVGLLLLQVKLLQRSKIRQVKLMLVRARQILPEVRLLPLQANQMTPAIKPIHTPVNQILTTVRQLQLQANQMLRKAKLLLLLVNQMHTEVKQVLVQASQTLAPDRALLLLTSRWKRKVNQIVSRANLMLTEVKQTPASKTLRTAKRLQIPASHMRIKVHLRLNQTNPPHLRMQR